jgi:hypothetical protein
LGFAFLENGRLKEAEQVLIDTLMIQPARVSAWINLGSVYARRNEHERVIGSWIAGYNFSQNKDKTRDYLKSLTTSTNNGEKIAAEEVLRRISGN